jgi:hypothetical protein
MTVQLQRKRTWMIRGYELTLTNDDPESMQCIVRDASGNEVWTGSAPADNDRKVSKMLKQARREIAFRAFINSQRGPIVPWVELPPELDKQPQIIRGQESKTSNAPVSMQTRPAKAFEAPSWLEDWSDKEWA